MRRRLRAVIWPFHRHSLPQLAIDAVLVAGAYFLAYRLRFDAGRPAALRRPARARRCRGPSRPRSSCSRSSASTPSSGATSASATSSRSSRRSLVATIVIIAAIAIAHPTTVPSPTGRVGVNLPSGLAAVFFLLTLALVGGARFVARTLYERPLRGFRPAKDARRVLIVGAGDGGQLVLREILRNPSLRPQPRRLRRRRPAQARPALRRRPRARRDRGARPDPRRGRARRDHDRDPVGAGPRCAPRS